MIPRAFRIREFRSIIDTGECALSSDGITVLAGQNEAGKSAILMALRDFDLEAGEPPLTSNFMPDDNLEAKPRVSVLFEVEADEIESALEEDEYSIPAPVLEAIGRNGKLWITRDLLSGKFMLEQKIVELWSPAKRNRKTAEESSEKSEAENASTDEEKQKTVVPELLSPEGFSAWLRMLWPIFVYFDAFSDTLPQEVDLELSQQTQTDPVTNIESAKTLAGVGDDVANTVQDFITLSGLNLETIASFANDDKALGNYLSKCSTSITGDFLNYWKQKTDGKETVDLLVKHMRSVTGILKLQFYVRDRTDQYPEQRSKGFLWFLSFYLRLAAWSKGESDSRLVLIDEPGSYLHAKAQRDILTVLEASVAEKNQAFIYTTHSPYLLPASTSHRWRVVIKKDMGGTKVLDRITHPLLSDKEFTDTLTPFITSMGFDVRDVLPVVGDHNLLVEGISDYIYIHTWVKMLKSDLVTKLHVFPGTGAPSLEALVSLFIGWGLPFAVLLDRDEVGNNVKAKLEKYFSLRQEQLIQPNSAATIEDMLAYDDFKSLLAQLDSKRFNMLDNERPSSAIKRHKIDKVLLARTYAELVNREEVTLSSTSQAAILQLLSSIAQGITVRPDYVDLIEHKF